MNYPSNRRIDLSRFTTADVDLGDIAHCLAYKIRWGGCADQPITVEDHSIFCERLLLLKDDVATTRLRLLMLLHDAHEAYLGDIRRPMAAQLGIDLAPLRAHVDRCIFKALGLYPPIAIEQRIIQHFDDWSLHLEALWFMPDSIRADMPGLGAVEIPDMIFAQHIARRPPGCTFLRNVTALLGRLADERKGIYYTNSGF